jgi:hypothetical protein
LSQLFKTTSLLIISKTAMATPTINIEPLVPNEAQQEAKEDILYDARSIGDIEADYDEEDGADGNEDAAEEGVNDIAWNAMRAFHKAGAS